MKSFDQIAILFVDDEESVISSLRRFFRKESYQIFFASNGQEALELMAHQPIHILVTDLRMPGMGGLELIERVKENYPDILRLICSATRDIEQTVESINSGEIFRFITKPFDPELFKQAILRSAEYYLLKNEREVLVEELSSANNALVQNNIKLDEAFREIYVAKRDQDLMQQAAKETERLIAEHLLQADLPEIPGISLAALSVPASNIAGDFYECINYGNAQFDLFVADVMGKGSLSALIGAGIKAMILKTLSQYDCRDATRTNCPYHDATEGNGINHVMATIHAAVIEKLITLETFATLCYARFDGQKRQMSFIDCGHPKTLHYHCQTGAITFLEGDAPPLGAVEQFYYKTKTVPLAEGDVLLFYSDGVTEAENATGLEFGPERLVALLTQRHADPVNDLLATIHQMVQVHTGQESLADDFTCIVVRVEAVSGDTLCAAQVS